MVAEIWCNGNISNNKTGASLSFGSLHYTNLDVSNNTNRGFELTSASISGSKGNFSSNTVNNTNLNYGGGIYQSGGDSDFYNTDFTKNQVFFIKNLQKYPTFFVL